MSFRIIKNQSAKSKNIFKTRSKWRKGDFSDKSLKNAKNTPLRSILIFDFNSNENQNLFKKFKETKIRRTTQQCNEDTKIHGKGEKYEQEGVLDDNSQNENDNRNYSRN